MTRNIFDIVSVCEFIHYQISVILARSPDCLQIMKSASVRNPNTIPFNLIGDKNSLDVELIDKHFKGI